MQCFYYSSRDNLQSKRKEIQTSLGSELFLIITVEGAIYKPLKTMSRFLRVARSPEKEL